MGFGLRDVGPLHAHVYIYIYIYRYVHIRNIDTGFDADV